MRVRSEEYVEIDAGPVTTAEQLLRQLFEDVFPPLVIDALVRHTSSTGTEYTEYMQGSGVITPEAIRDEFAPFQGGVLGCIAALAADPYEIGVEVDNSEFRRTLIEAGIPTEKNELALWYARRTTDSPSAVVRTHLDGLVGSAQGYYSRKGIFEALRAVERGVGLRR